jgi:membrane-associated phospholipid phosphatase
MKTTLFLLIIFFYSSSIAQKTDTKAHNSAPDTEDSSRIIGHVYHVNAWASIGMFTAGELAVGIAQRLFSKPEITNQEFDAAQLPSSINSINVFDRWVLRMNVPTVDYTWTAVGIQAVCAAAPLTLLFGDRYRKNWDDIVLMMMEVNALATCMFQFSPFGPYFQNRYRPAVYYARDSVSRAAETNGGERNSFFSGHTNSATASLYLMAKIYCDYNPQIQGWDKVGIYALASIPPLIMGYFRIIALRHFPSDVLVGGLIGGACGIIVPELHRIQNNNVSLGVYSSPESSGINIAWNLK